MVKYRIALMMFSLAVAAPVLADTDASMHDVYAAAQSGHLAQAQQMMTQVLRDHPKSAKAHYVAAEIYAKEGNFSLARGEFNVAEQLEPGLPFAKPESVQELRSEIAAPGAGAGVVRPVSRPAAGIPWGMLLIGVVVIVGLWLLLRRRTPSYGAPMIAGGPAYPGAMGGPAYGGAPYGGPGYGAPGGGIGSGIAGGLASGLAVGAGVVAGEELAHHFLDGRRDTTLPPPAEEPNLAASNGDMGGSDFGVTEDPGSWDDSNNSSGGDFGSGGGGDDWS
jgi:hypothetical protein